MSIGDFSLTKLVIFLRPERGVFRPTRTIQKKGDDTIDGILFEMNSKYIVLFGKGCYVQ